jgi:hypothetical protein
MMENTDGFRTTLRKIMASLLLKWAFQILPDGKFKKRFSGFLMINIEDL